MTNLWKRAEGQSLVELALILPMLLLVIFGLIESARMMQAMLAVQSAAREGARYAVTGQPSPEECGLDPENYDEDVYRQCRVDSIKEIARTHTVGLPIDPTETDPGHPGYLGIWVRGQPTWEEVPVLDHPGIPGTRVEVTVFFNLPVVVPLFSALLPSVRLTGRTQMINEGFEMTHGGDTPPILPPAPTPPPLDYDDDLVCDSEERDIYGTSPTLPDTDGDEQSDGDEIGDFLCDEEQEPGSPITDPLDPCDPWPGPDHDGDGKSDCEEDAYPGQCLDPYKPDTDEDGLNDGYEMDHACLDPCNPDTDGDGLSDGYEVDPGCEGCDPCDPNLPPTPTPGP